LRVALGLQVGLEVHSGLLEPLLCGRRDVHRAKLVSENNLLPRNGCEPPFKRSLMTGCFARSISRTVLAGYSPSEIGEALLHSTTADAVQEQNEGARRVYAYPEKGDLRAFRDGASRTRTGDLLGAIQALSQLSYSPAGASV
jgi:hypothetical protein